MAVAHRQVATMRSRVWRAPRVMRAATCRALRTKAPANPGSSRPTKNQQRWRSRRSSSTASATLLGDACHPMLPFLAQGAGQAVKDAAALARCLSAKPAHFRTALARYETARRGVRQRVRFGRLRGERRVRAARPPEPAHIPMGQDARRAGSQAGPAARCAAFVRDDDAPTPSSDRGDFPNLFCEPTAGQSRQLSQAFCERRGVRHGQATRTRRRKGK
jgi:2-polyprenyl-6-methoxyphenol hydroxylase-like FAD-dependent oxidoreductase